MRWIKRGIAVVWATFSVYLMLSGASVVVNTSGTVQGSEFGMLITLANQFGLVMIWLALGAIWRVFPSSEQGA